MQARLPVAKLHLSRERFAMYSAVQAPRDTNKCEEVADEDLLIDESDSDNDVN